MKTDIYTTPIILGIFSVAKVIIIFGNNKHINDFFEKKSLLIWRKESLLVLKRSIARFGKCQFNKKSPCTVPRQIGNTARGIYNIGDIFSFHSQMRFQLNIYVTSSSNSKGRR